MPHLVVALDKFKGSLTSREAGEALATGLRATSAHPVQVLEVADEVVPHPHDGGLGGAHRTPA